MEPIATTITEHYINIGIQKGKLEGIQKGTTSVLSKLIAKKFQVAPKESLVFLKLLSPQDMIELTDIVLDCDSWDNIKAWILERAK